VEKTREDLEVQDMEVDLVLEAILKKTDFDYRDYSRSHIKRRLSHRLGVLGYKHFSDLIPDILHKPKVLSDLMRDLSINVTEMFRDPEFFKVFSKRVFPYLETYPFLRCWHAGCSSGQEVYSMAILLEEYGLLQRTQIYATDFNHSILNIAKEGIYPVENIKKYTVNYQKAGGNQSFCDYYTAQYDSAVIKPNLKKNILFSFHNLVTDGVFGEMHVIFCRNVLIYFNKELQDKVLRLFYASLVPGGFLCLGSKESIRYSSVEGLFEPVCDGNRIYRKRFA